MKRKMLQGFLLMLFVFILLDIGVFFGLRAAFGGTGVQVVNEKLVIQDPQSDHGNQFMIEDKNGAPMAWVNMFGLQSGAEPVCAMDRQLRPVVCLGGKFRQYGVGPMVVFYHAGKVWKVIR